MGRRYGRRFPTVTRAPRFFRSPAAFRTWLAANHATATELLVGYYKKDSGKASMTWSESVDEAICFGWIDGRLSSLDAERYAIRFTPRKPGSVWSKVNIEKVQRLTAAGRMQPAGLAAFEARRANRSGIYAFEQGEIALDAASAAALAKHRAARRFFEAQPASYRKTVIWWIISAKKEETRARRLAELIARSAKQERIAQFSVRVPAWKKAPAAKK